MQFGARIEIKNSRGKTPRDIICQRTKKFEDEGIDINSVNSEGLRTLLNMMILHLYYLTNMNA